MYTAEVASPSISRSYSASLNGRSMVEYHYDAIVIADKVIQIMENESLISHCRLELPSEATQLLVSKVFVLGILQHQSVRNCKDIPREFCPSSSSGDGPKLRKVL